MPIGLGGAALISGGANIIGGLLGRSGQNSANEANLAIARENREWQERMSSTAYQRATKDLEASGLNRILALGSPSSTPAGNTATMLSKEAPLQEGIKQGVSTALQAQLLKKQVEKMDAEIGYTEARTKAITPAAKVGEGAGAVADMLKEPYQALTDRASRLIDETDYKSMFDTTANMAKQNIDDIANSVKVRPDYVRPEIIKIMKQMDLPKMTEREMYQWALDNPEKIQKFLQRKRQQGFN